MFLHKTKREIREIIEEIRPQSITTPTETILYRIRKNNMSLREAFYIPPFSNTQNTIKLKYPHKTIPNLYLSIDL